MTTNIQHTIIQSLVDAYPLMGKNNDTVNDVGVIEPAFPTSVLVCVVSHTSSSTTSERSRPDPWSAWAMCVCFVHNSQTQKLLYFFVIRLPSVGSTANTILCVVSNTSSVCVCVCFLPIHSGHQVLWTYQPGSHRRKVTQDFSSTLFLWCVP